VKNPLTLHLYLMKSFIPVLLVSISFFILLLQLLDVFGNLGRYLSQEVPLLTICMIAFYYIPKCILFSLPVALLFSVSYTLGILFSNNELIAVFGSGIRINQFVKPLLYIGLFFSLFNFFFEDQIVIASLQKKKEIYREALNLNDSLNRNRITISSLKGSVIYNVESYRENDKSLNNVQILLRKKGHFSKKIESKKVYWNEDGYWDFPEARIFYISKTTDMITDRKEKNWKDELLIEPPVTFQKKTLIIDEMKASEAWVWIQRLKNSGEDIRGSLSDYYKRFSFSMTPFIVILISGALGGRFRKNILLMSLLLSLIIAVIYYIAQMLMTIYAKLGYMPPFVGAVLPVFIFFVIGLFLFYFAKT